MSSAVVTWDDLGSHVDGTPVHALRLLVGTDLDGLAEGLASGHRPMRPIMCLNDSTYAHDTPGGIVHDAVDDLARMVAARWPFLWNDDLSDVREEVLSRAHLPLRLARLAERLPGLSVAWATRAARRMMCGLEPRTAHAPPALAWKQLVLAFSPVGLTLVAPLPRRAPATTLAALEWLAECAPVAVVLLAPTLPPSDGPFDRILFGARELAGRKGRTAPRDGTAAVLADVEVDGRPHPGSDAERRLYELIRMDPELGPLFGFNRIAPEVSRAQARIDILWSAGRVAVEVDGPEHRGSARYRADRHRDYELLCAGYRVLRLTNEEVAEDAGLAVAKIRDVVRLSRTEGP